MQLLEEIHESYTESELEIQGEYASEETMAEWGWSQLFACSVAGPHEYPNFPDIHRISKNAMP